MTQCNIPVVDVLLLAALPMERNRLVESMEHGSWEGMKHGIPFSDSFSTRNNRTESGHGAEQGLEAGVFKSLPVLISGCDRLRGLAGLTADTIATISGPVFLLSGR